MRFPIGSMTVGDVLDRGVRLLIARLPLLFGINLIVMLPMFFFSLAQPFLLQSLMESAKDGEPSASAIIGFAGGGLAAFALYILFLPLAIAATLTVTIREYLGQTATIGDALGSAFRRFLPLIGTSFLVWLLTMLATLACCIPGIYVGVIYLFASQVVVAEAVGGMPALNRSSSLVSGHWWRIFAVSALVVVIATVVQMIVIMPLAIFLPPQEAVRTEAGMSVVINIKNQLIQAVAQMPLQVVFQAYQAVCTTLLYLDMRIRKEGLDLQIAAQQIEQGGVGEA